MTLALRNELVLVIGGRIATALIALATIRAVTSYLTPAQYGELALLLTVQMFCGLFLINPIGQHINLHTHAWWDDRSLSGRLAKYNKYVIAVSLVGAAAAIVVDSNGSADSRILKALTMFSMVLFGTWNATLIPLLNMLGFRAASIFWGTITSVVSLISSICFVAWHASAIAWFAGQVIGLGVGALGAKYFFLRSDRMKSDIVRPDANDFLIDRKTIVGYCLPLALATGLMWLQVSGYRLVVNNFWTLEQLGYLAIGLQVAGQLWGLIENLAIQFLYPMFYRRVSDHENKPGVEQAFSDLLNTLLPIYFVFTGVLIASSEYLLKLLVAPEFQGAIGFLAVGIGIELCRVLGNILSAAAHVRRKTMSLALPYFLGALTTISSIFLAGLVQKDISWAGGGLLLGGGVMLFTMAISMYRQVKFSIDGVRFLIGVIVILVLTLGSSRLPSAHGFAQNVGMLVIMGTLGCIVTIALLWQNPGARRLISVKLKSK